MNEQDDIDRQIADQGTGRTAPRVGPSDSSDTASELPSDLPDTDSDRQNTGERADVENVKAPDADDIETDAIVSEDDVGLAHTPPDPVRNGGR